MNTLSKALFFSVCLALVSFSAQAGDKKASVKENIKKSVKAKCDINEIKNFSKELVRFCAKNAIGKDKKGWMMIESATKSKKRKKNKKNKKGIVAQSGSGEI